MIIIRYSEIFLKGKNRINFERRLVENIRFALKDHNSESKIRAVRNRILVDDDNASYLKDVFGVHSISIAKGLPIDIAILKEEAFHIAESNKDKFKTFKIDTKRINKDNQLNSVTIDRDVGERIYEELQKKVSLDNPEFTIYLEIIDEAYIFTEKIAGPGGLPLGVEGKIFALIEDKEGLTAAKMMMRRGCIVFPIYFEENKFKDEIQKLSPGFKIKEFKIAAFDELDQIAYKLDVKAIAVPDTIAAIKDYSTGLPIFRPLISTLL